MYNILPPILFASFFAACAVQNPTSFGEESADLAKATYACSVTCDGEVREYASCALSSNAAEQDAESLCSLGSQESVVCNLEDTSPCETEKPRQDWRSYVQEAETAVWERAVARGVEPSEINIAFRGIVIGETAADTTAHFFLNESSSYAENGVQKCVERSYMNSGSIEGISSFFGQSCEDAMETYQVPMDPPNCSADYVWTFARELYGPDMVEVRFVGSSGDNWRGHWEALERGGNVDVGVDVFGQFDDDC